MIPNFSAKNRPSLALQATLSDTSTYTTATIQASYAIAPDFFNGLLEDERGILPLPGRPHVDA